MKRTPLAERKLPDYTRGEEIMNMVSHIVGGGLAVAALVLCVVVAAIHQNIWGVVSGAVYGFTMIVLYTMSSLYHGLKPTCIAKKVLQVIDHCSIYFLIAGTYTPVTLCAIRPVDEALAWWIFGIVWGLAALGVTLNAIDLRKFRVISMILYLGMGWCVVISVPKMLGAIAPAALWLMLAGGIAYTFGAILYGLGRTHRYAHSVFHLFVVIGSVLHFFSILLYMM